MPLMPQEWLWCETWCGNATKSYARTIDLCNNPLTKEPKLEGARRIVKEWPGLDEEVATFTAQVQDVWISGLYRSVAARHVSFSSIRCLCSADMYGCDTFWRLCETGYQYS